MMKQFYPGNTKGVVLYQSIQLNFHNAAASFVELHFMEAESCGLND